MSHSQRTLERDPHIPKQIVRRRKHPEEEVTLITL